MRILFIGKRHYTNKDAFHERFGRIYQLPLQWHLTGNLVGLLLVDYHGATTESSEIDGFQARSLPIRNPKSVPELKSRTVDFKADVIVASGDCFIALMALRLARKTGARFVFDVYDDYRTFGAYRAFLGWDAFGYLLRHADSVWYASRALASDHPSKTTHSVVHNGVNPEEFRPIDSVEARARLGLSQDRRWIGYFGSLEIERGPEDLVTAVGQLHARNPAINLVLCGGGAQTDLRAPWVEYRGNVPHFSIPDYINACDVVVLPYRRGRTIDMVSSCKMAEYLFCQRPIVATRTPSLVSNFAEQACELGAAICEPSNASDLARAIDSQLAHPRIATAPLDLTWSSIASTALSSITTT